MSNELKDFFKLPLSVNATYAENELRDGYGDFILSMEGNAHELRLIAKAVNDYGSMKDQITQLERDKADLLAVLPNLISGWDYEELANCGGVDADTAARVIKLVENAE